MIEAEHRALARKLAHGLGIGFLACVVLIWSWNTVAVDLLDAPAMMFRHALAVLLMVVTLTLAVSWAARLFRVPPDKRAG
jgi:hypothetical protein